MKKLKNTTQKDYAQRMLTVISYIQEHLDENISLEELADIACFSKYHFHRIFTGMTGETVQKYIRGLRLERAAIELIKTERSVLDIALDAGYETHESFTRAFNTMFSMPPQTFRNKQKFRDDKITFNTLLNVKAIVLKQFNDKYIGESNMKVEIVDLPATKVAFVRSIGPYNECGKAWETLCSWAAPQGLIRPGCTFFGLSYDDPDVTDPDKIRYDACISVDYACQPEGDVQTTELPAGTYAKTTHFGPYDNLNKTYSELCGQWIPSKGYEIASGPSIEIYLNSPEDTEPEELITDIHIPLVKE